MKLFVNPPARQIKTLLVRWRHRTDLLLRKSSRYSSKGIDSHTDRLHKITRGPRIEASTSNKTWADYYRPNLAAISCMLPWRQRLDRITSEKAADFAAWRKSHALQVSSVNSSLQVLRRVLRLAMEWDVIGTNPPRIKMLPGERHREHVVLPEEEARYLAAAPEPLLPWPSFSSIPGCVPTSVIACNGSRSLGKMGETGHCWSLMGKRRQLAEFCL